MSSAASTPIETPRQDAPVPPSVDATRLERVIFEIKRVIVGQDRLVERMLVALLARGHVLLEGVPGVAKTLAVETLATAVGAVTTGFPARCRTLSRGRAHRSVAGLP